MYLRKTDVKWCSMVERLLRESGEVSHLQLAERIKTCRLYRTFGSSKPKYCNLERMFLCPKCYIRLKRKWANDKAIELASLCSVYRMRPLFLTLRIEAGPNLLERFDCLSKILDRIKNQRRNFKAGRRRSNEFCRPEYILWMIEVARDTSGKLWYPHVHGVALNPLGHWKFDRKRLAQDWGTVSDSSVPPHVKNCDRKRSRQTNIRREITYSMKATRRDRARWLSPEDRIFAFDSLHRKRLVREMSWAHLNG
jgi:hypothetical protein